MVSMETSVFTWPHAELSPYVSPTINKTLQGSPISLMCLLAFSSLWSFSLFSFSCRITLAIVSQSLSCNHSLSACLSLLLHLYEARCLFWVNAPKKELVTKKEKGERYAHWSWTHMTAAFLCQDLSEIQFMMHGRKHAGVSLQDEGAKRERAPKGGLSEWCWLGVLWKEDEKSSIGGGQVWENQSMGLNQWFCNGPSYVNLKDIVELWQKWSFPLRCDICLLKLVSRVTFNIFFSNQTKYMDYLKFNHQIQLQ